MSFAIQIKVDDPELRFYMQQYPFLTGPDEGKNQQALRAIRQGLCLNEQTSGGAIERQPHRTLSLDASELERARALLTSAGLSEAEIADAVHDYAWRVQAISVHAQSVLCVGSGAGHELAFVRARLPQARIVVMDYVSKVIPGLLQAVGAEFRQCDFAQALRDLDESFDVVFSNHTLEHMYDPCEVLGLLHKGLNAGGMLVSGLPMDADQAAPLSQEILQLAKQAQRLNIIDMGVLDAGHPWKTNPSDIVGVFHSARFEGVRVLQREDVPSRSLRNVNPSSPHESKQGAINYHRTFGVLRAVLRRLWPHGAPLTLRRLLVALERRTPFGANRLQARHSPDVIVLACKNG